MVYENSNTKETFKVIYNSIKSRKSSNLGSKSEGSKTITQKPDNVLSIDKLGSDKAYEFVFDAKYKIDTSIVYRKSYGGIRPKEDDNWYWEGCPQLGHPLSVAIVSRNCKMLGELKLKLLHNKKRLKSSETRSKWIRHCSY